MFSRLSISLSTLVLALIVATSTAFAQSLDADAKELQAYTLTTAALKQFVQATRAMMAAAKADPRFGEVMKLEAEIDKLESKEEPTEADEERLEKMNEQLEVLKEKLPRVNMADAELKTLSDVEGAIKREPLMANALKSAGMAPRDYAKFTLAFFQAAMIHGMQKSGMVKEIPKDLQATVNMENIKFIEANQTEINALMKEFQAASRQY
jgi:DNA repair exonuclease SbcCD ATPase subunit